MINVISPDNLDPTNKLYESPKIKDLASALASALAFSPKSKKNH